MNSRSTTVGLSPVIPEETFIRICRPCEGAATCRYIAAGPGGITCEKHSNLAKQMDAKVEAGTFVARGDNCEGLK